MNQQSCRAQTNQPTNVVDQRTRQEVIVSMTSWKKRIGGLHLVIESLLAGSMVPDRIVCNLSVEEFPNKERELPETLVELTHNTVFELHWVEGNTKAFKKVIPTLLRFPEAVVISADDDVIYKSDFVECLYRSFVACGSWQPVTSRQRTTLGIYFTCGPGSVYTRSMFGEALDLLDDQTLATGEDDWFYTFALLLNNMLVRPSKGTNVKLMHFTDQSDSLFPTGYDTGQTRRFWHKRVEELTGMSVKQFIRHVKRDKYHYTQAEIIGEQLSALAKRTGTKIRKKAIELFGTK